MLVSEDDLALRTVQPHISWVSISASQNKYLQEGVTWTLWDYSSEPDCGNRCEVTTGGNEQRILKVLSGAQISPKTIALLATGLVRNFTPLCTKCVCRWFLCNCTIHSCAPAERLHTPYAFSEVEPATPTSLNWTAGVTHGRERTGTSGRWHRSGTQQLGEGLKEEEGFVGTFRSAESFHRAASLCKASRKMNSFILLSLFATVIAGKSPRLKFVVHGKQLLYICFNRSHSTNVLCR